MYVASLAVLFGVSALYHRRSWRPRLRAVIRRLDHATIFVLIAGSYTAVVGLALPWEQGGTTLTVVCAGAIVGIVAGGLLYTLGAVVYATRRPRLVPHVFGYHEVFHALVIAASICHTLLITSLAG